MTVVDRDGVGGAAVLTDCVPSKTLIATAEVMTIAAGSRSSASSSVTALSRTAWSVSISQRSMPG